MILTSGFGNGAAFLFCEIWYSVFTTKSQSEKTRLTC